jgi:trehalose 6-phosphate synthase
VEAFYNGYANQALWPVLHYRIDLAHFDRQHAETYQRVNERMAARLWPLLQPTDTVWVHDYHYIPFGEHLRAAGFGGAIGFFLHVPFPAPEIMAALPDARRLVRALFAYDVLGFQTGTDRDNFGRFVLRELGGRELAGGRIEAAGRVTEARVFPIGIDAERFGAFSRSAEGTRRFHQMRSALGDRRQIIGVDRLDYSKGIPERLKAFERLLTDYPEARGRVSLLQVAPVSRGDVGPYAELRRVLEESAGHINGAFGQLDWTPVRIMTRGFARRGLAGLFRASHVGLVTPLRDGMNLVAKEYVAAQDPADPGVLVLSRFAGAAHELSEALIVNPHDTEEVAEALQTALQMPLDERQRRWEVLIQAVRAGSATAWCAQFLAALEIASGAPAAEVLEGRRALTRGAARIGPPAKHALAPAHGGWEAMAAARPPIALD